MMDAWAKVGRKIEGANKSPTKVAMMPVGHFSHR